MRTASSTSATSSGGAPISGAPVRALRRPIEWIEPRTSLVADVTLDEPVAYTPAGLTVLQTSYVLRVDQMIRGQVPRRYVTVNDNECTPTARPARPGVPSGSPRWVERSRLCRRRTGKSAHVAIGDASVTPAS
jgi:hypothetical protein